MKKADYLDIIKIFENNSSINSIKYWELLWIINSLIEHSLQYTSNFIDRIKFVLIQLEFLFKNVKQVHFEDKFIVNAPTSTLIHDHYLKIIHILNYYFLGKIYSSQRSFVYWFNSLKPLENKQTIETDFYTFRGRVRNSEIKFNSNDLLHIPFEKRNLVENYRYSISGFPALYLSSSIFCSWEELRRPSLTNLTISAFKPKKNWHLFDMRLYRNFNSTKQLNHYLKILPLLIACSFPVAVEKGSFHPEYIIPQFIMASMVSDRYSKTFDGISYNSTRIGHDFSFVSKTIIDKFNCGFNIVLPVMSDQKGGHCPALLEKLFQSDTVSFDQFIIENDLEQNWNQSNSILDKWEEHIKNKKMSYNRLWINKKYN